MTSRQTRQFEMLVRVDKNGKKNRERIGTGGEAEVAFGVVAAAVEEVERFHKAKLHARRDNLKTKLTAKAALQARISTIAGAARVMAKTVPDADARFPLPKRRSDVLVLHTGRLFVEEAEAAKEKFIRCGLPATFVEDLQQAVAAFAQAIDGCSAGKTGSVVSNAAVRAALTRGVDAVSSLDVLVAIALGHDAHAMKAWRNDRHIVAVGKTSSSSPPVSEATATTDPVSLAKS